MYSSDEELSSEIITRDVLYQCDGTTCKGFLAYNTLSSQKRPAILAVHEFWGLNDFIKTKVISLAALGYVAFAADMYGEGRTASDMITASEMAGKIRGTPLMGKRVLAGYDSLIKQKMVDPQSIAAIGFCFGGTAVLELAYSGADLQGIVVFHGTLSSPSKEDTGRIKSRILILHGADDHFTSDETIISMQNGFRSAGVDWQMIIFGGAVHGFTNSANGTDNSKGVAYNPQASRCSWQYMQMFFNEVLRDKNKHYSE